MKKTVLRLLLASLLVVSLASCSGSKKEGVFTGVGQGIHGDIKVEVTVADGEITAIEVKEHNETEGISKTAIAEIPQSIVDNQSIEVDVVSGASKTSNGIIAAVEDALKNGKMDLADFTGKAVVKKDAVVLEDATYDVVVIGAGGAGLTAAVTAREEGAKVLLIEKMPFAGGNTMISGGEMGIAGSWVQDEKGVEDSPEIFANDLYVGGDKLGKYEVAYAVAAGSSEMAYWLRDTVGVDFKEGHLGLEGGHSVARTIRPNTMGSGLILPLVKYAEKIGVEIMYNTMAEKFIQDESGRVTGVEVSNGDSTAVFNGTKGIVMASGGFGANVEMREHYNTVWESLGESMPTSNAPSIVGDGIVMGEAIGANLMNMGQIQLYPFNNPKTGVFYNIEAPNWMNEGHIYVNKDGNRFVNEMSTRKYRAAGIIAQGDYVYCLYNQAVADRLNMEEDHAERYAQTLEQGVFFKADTLEEVAEYFDINAENLVKTVDKYNESMRNGVDEEFGRTDGMVPMDEGGPWFILQGSVTIHHCMGGVEIDENCHVIDVNGNIIPGLYGAGEVTGSTHGSERIGSCAVTDVMVLGRISGKAVANSL